MRRTCVADGKWGDYNRCVSSGQLNPINCVWQQRPYRGRWLASPASIAVDLLACNVGAQRLQLFLDVLVAAIDLADVADDALPLRTQRG